METEEFWKGQFGHEYQERQKQSRVGSVESNLHMFGSILYKKLPFTSVSSILEVGAGTGQNIRAIHHLFPEWQCISIELNQAAAEQIPFGEVLIGDCLSIEWPNADLVLSKGVAVHIPPEVINKFYSKLYESANKYILLAEYFSDQRQEIAYRGNSGKLWKANFYDEITSMYPNLKCIDYGFVGRWDEHPEDNLNWWLFEKMV